MCPLRGDRTRGLAPFVGIGEARFRAEPMTGCPFNPGRRLHPFLPKDLSMEELDHCGTDSVDEQKNSAAVKTLVGVMLALASCLTSCDMAYSPVFCNAFAEPVNLRITAFRKDSKMAAGNLGTSECSPLPWQGEVQNVLDD